MKERINIRFHVVDLVSSSYVKTTFFLTILDFDRSFNSLIKSIILHVVVRLCPQEVDTGDVPGLSRRRTKTVISKQLCVVGVSKYITGTVKSSILPV